MSEGLSLFDVLDNPSLLKTKFGTSCEVGRCGRGRREGAEGEREGRREREREGGEEREIEAKEDGDY